MKAKDFIPASKPRNFVAKNQKTAGAGQHKDKRKAEKQGDVKHKNKQYDEGVAEGIMKSLATRLVKGAANRQTPQEIANTHVRALNQRAPGTRMQGHPNFADFKKEVHSYISAAQNGKQAFARTTDDHVKSLFKKYFSEGVAEGSYTTEKQILTRIRQIMYDRKLSGTESNAGELLRLKQQLKDLRSRQGVAEGDEPNEQYLDKVISDLYKDAYGMRPDHEFGREWMSSNYEEKLEIYKSMLKNLHSDVNEASDFGEPREILEDVLQTLEREVEWPLTEVMDPREVRQLLAPIIKAVNDKMMSMEEAQDDWGGMSHREFKRKELQHELGHEDDPDFERKMRQQQMDKDKGPWYIRINGKIYKQKGEAKVFDWRKGANNYALAILKNKPELQGKVLITKNPADQ